MQLAYLEKRHLWNHFYSYIIITKKRQVLNLHSHLKWSFQSYCIVPKTPWTRKDSWYLPPLSELSQNNINEVTNNHIRIWWRWQSDYEIITQATIERQQTHAHTPRWPSLYGGKHIVCWPTLDIFRRFFEILGFFGGSCFKLVIMIEILLA